MAELTWQQAIQEVLGESNSGLHCQEITERIVQLGLRKSIGATPQRTVAAQLSGSVKRDGDDSPYVKVGRATYALRANLNYPSSSHAEAASDQKRPSNAIETGSDDEDETGLIQAFGMYWQREQVHWTSSPCVNGRQQIGATTVDFSGQRGVYLLHDGREVVYVGRSVERPLGRRLFEHTQDRLRSRWNRFSWFGLRRVTEEGELLEVIYTPSEALVAVTLEALLIEGLEPRQNRRRGDGFTAVEYLQAEDPEIERQRVHSLLESMKSRI